MASGPTRRLSKELPPDLSELMDRIIKEAASFIKEFDCKEPRMREIVREFMRIVDEIKTMQERTDTARTAGTATAGAGLGLGLIGVFAAPFTGGLSLALAAAGGAAAVGGGATVVGVNVTKTLKENGSAKKVEELGKEFVELVEPLKINLTEIKTTCEKLEKKSSEVQAGSTLSGVEEFQWILRRVSELRKRSEETVNVAVAVLGFIGNLLMLFVKVFRFTANPEEDEKLRVSIIQSADQCQKVVDEFDQMKKELKDFTGR
ncbi:apolipoprotein L3-like [Dicentrarchus labrax]|uniref:apolipoprotein L3-like n=1 Tax=Dicentrarchus labrax TaxID=13489 RepID=UPI0021F64F8B|nr:apolipoprotein L3-like [Dicentrarchus labrax]